MKQLKPPTPLTNIESQEFTIFLAGSIEQGRAEPWQEQIVEALHDTAVTILNPRRDEWDDTWEQSIENPLFKEQVEWELDAQEQADIIVMFFSPKTQSPITLLELGLFARHKKMVVCCPDGFWRKGNVDIVCQRYGIEQVAHLTGLISYLKKHI